MAPKLIEFVNNFPPHGIHSIKLKDLLALRSQENLTREIRTSFPPVTIGSVTLVDQIVLLCLDELVAPEVILEIGTFQGFTTRLFTRNSAARRIYSVDLPPTLVKAISTPSDNARLLSDGDYNDDHLRDVQRHTGEIFLNDLSPDDAHRISLIKADSTRLDFVEEFGSLNFAFIDGGHHYDIVSHDTESSLQVLSQGVIVWHDFSSGIHSDVTRYLTERAIDNQLFHVLGSLCAFQIVRS